MLRLEIYLGETANVMTLGHRLNEKHSDAANTSCISHESSNTSMDQQLSSCPVSFNRIPKSYDLRHYRDSLIIVTGSVISSFSFLCENRPKFMRVGRHS